MSEEDSVPKSVLTELAAQIVSAYVEKNPVSSGELPKLIGDVYQAMSELGDKSATETEKPKPAVNPKRSVFNDYIICLENGKKFKSLKRHLRTSHDLSPEEYRERWGLAPDYPMVAPGYAEQRSTLAKKLGLGRKPKSKTRRK